MYGARTRAMRRSFAAALALVALLTACTDPSDPPAAAPSGPPQQPEPAGSPEPVPDRCEGPLPVFVARLDLGAPHGEAGPAPGSEPALPGQQVRHWLTGYASWELRWPPTAREPVEDATMPSGLVPGFETVEVDTQDPRRLAVDIRIPGASDPCGSVGLEVSEVRLGPLIDELRAFASSLRPAAQLAEFEAALRHSEDDAVGRQRRPAGECAEPVVLDGPIAGDDGLTTTEAEAAAVEAARRFVDDRVAGAQAEDCLTASGLGAFISTNTNGTCLYACPSGWALRERIGDPQLLGGGPDGVMVWIPVELTSPDGRRRQVEEDVTVRFLWDGHARVARVVDVGANDLTWVEVAARAAVEHLLESLAAEAWDAAYEYLTNEGVADEVATRLGGWDAFWEDRSRLPALCDRALCAAAYDLLETTVTGPYGALTVVRFSAAQGDVEVPLDAGAFEGLMTPNALPPDGAVGRRLDPFEQRLFRGRDAPPIVAVRERYLVRPGPGGPEWVAAGTPRGVSRLDVVGPWLVYEWSDVIEVAPIAGPPEHADSVIARGTLIAVGQTERGPAAVVESAAGDRRVISVPGGEPLDVAVPREAVRGEGTTVVVEDVDGRSSTWEAPGIVRHVEYDGRWIVAHLDDPELEPLWGDPVPLGKVLVVDTEVGDSWTVDTYAEIRFLES